MDNNNNLIKNIKAIPKENGEYEIEVVTDCLTFIEHKVNSIVVDSSIANYKSYTDKESLYSHMLYVRLANEYEKRIEYLKEHYSVDNIINCHAYEISEMQDILFVLEDNNINADRAVELLQCPGDLLGTMFEIRESRDSSCENEEIQDMIEFDDRILRFATEQSQGEEKQ